jgi:hypothetical protein
MFSIDKYSISVAYLDLNFREGFNFKINILDGVTPEHKKTYRTF